MSILAQVDLSLALNPDAYAEQLDGYQSMLSQLVGQALAQKRPIVIVFEGWPGAGQAAAIQRLTEKLDPGGYVVHSATALDDDDRAQHYLYRFWRRLPERGYVAVFDGSWYERVLAERVEGACTEAEWKRAYREIDQFERQLVEFGTIVAKFWLHISRDEQLRRLQDGRELLAEERPASLKRELYEAAVEEMLLKTSTLAAPWTIVEADDERWAQVKVLRTAVETLSAALDYMPGEGNRASDVMGPREAPVAARQEGIGKKAQ